MACRLPRNPGGGTVAVQTRPGVSDGDSLGQTLEMGQPQFVSQARLTGEQKGQAVLAVPVEVGQLGQVGEQVGPQVMPRSPRGLRGSSTSPPRPPGRALLPFGRRGVPEGDRGARGGAGGRPDAI